MSYNADRDSSRMMISRAEVVETHEDEDDLALVTLYGQHGETLRKIHRVQQFGDAYRPPRGAHGMLLSAGGRRDQAMFFGGEEASKRPRDLGEGERALYNSHGDKIFIYKEKIKTVTKHHEVVADNITWKGAVAIEGNITHTGNLTSTGTHTASAHV